MEDVPDWISSIAGLSDEYTIVADTYGRLRWASGEADGHPLLCITSEDVTEEYLEHLQEQGISWIATGRSRIDLPRKLMTVGRNSYVSLFKHHYSVPKECVGRRVTMLYDADTVEIYCGMNLVATHCRCDIPYTYSWKKEHNLPGHYGPYDKDLEELFRRASAIDNIVLDYLREVERVMQYPPKAFRSCRGILALEKKYGRDRLIAACACAGQKLRYGYQDLREVLELGEDADFLPDEDGKVLPNEASPVPLAHKNIHGSGYYSKDSNEQ